jgi:hypothetical protein
MTRGQAYNGQQGDIWDPHKDMALALLGATVAVVVQTIAVRRDDSSKVDDVIIDQVGRDRSSQPLGD